MKNAVDGMWHFENLDFSENLNFLKKKEFFENSEFLEKYWVLEKNWDIEKFRLFCSILIFIINFVSYCDCT